MSEDFDDVTNLAAPKGWDVQNLSQQIGNTGWFQGNTSLFTAYAGALNSYIAANYTNGTNTATISDWLLTPPIVLQQGGKLIFYTRTVSAPQFPDRLQVRMSTNGNSTDVGFSATSVGDFTTLLLDINPSYSTTGYPTVWTQYTITLDGIPAQVTGRLAFRYFVENGGPEGTNSDYIGIDAVSYACDGNATPAPSATPTPTPRAHALNLSTRLRVGTGNDVGIAGFIVNNGGSRLILVRGIGPSLGNTGIPNALADPALELHGPALFTNNNWRDAQEEAILATGIAPTNDLEAAILVGLDPGPYTAILKGNDGGVGVGLVEIYDLGVAQTSKLDNISTRGVVGTGGDIVIAGFILGGGSTNNVVLIRGIGPSLASSGVTNALMNPTLELRNSEGAIINTNDNWQDGRR